MIKSNCIFQKSAASKFFIFPGKSKGEEVAIERLDLIDNLLVGREPLDKDLTKIVGEIKATKTMSFADCCIAGLQNSKTRYSSTKILILIKSKMRSNN